LDRSRARVPITAKEELLDFVTRVSFREEAEPVFTLASGIKSRFYVDAKMALAFPRVRELAGRLVLERVDVTPVDAVGGLAMGAIPLAIAVSDAIHHATGRNVPAFVVRKEAKQHGLQKFIEGYRQAGARALIVDDVITSGGSTIEAIEKSRNEGMVVEAAVALIDRQESSGRENIERAGVRFHAILTLAELQEHARRIR
jgi:orotate phosphoribosyltransferase